MLYTDHPVSDIILIIDVVIVGRLVYDPDQSACARMRPDTDFRYLIILDHNPALVIFRASNENSCQNQSPNRPKRYAIPISHNKSHFHIAKVKNK